MTSRQTINTASKGIRVTATDLDDPAESGSRDIRNDYVLITAGSCEVTSVQVFNKADGTSTHQVTIKGIRRPVGPEETPNG